MKSVRIAMLWILMLLFVAAGAAQTPRSTVISKSVTVTRDLTYARYGQRELKLDLYRPSGSVESLPRWSS